jgi:hypothetical protein
MVVIALLNRSNRLYYKFKTIVTTENGFFAMNLFLTAKNGLLATKLCREDFYALGKQFSKEQKIQKTHRSDPLLAAATTVPPPQISPQRLCHTVAATSSTTPPHAVTVLEDTDVVEDAW